MTRQLDMWADRIALLEYIRLCSPPDPCTLCSTHTYELLWITTERKQFAELCHHCVRRLNWSTRHDPRLDHPSLL